MKMSLKKTQYVLAALLMAAGTFVGGLALPQQVSAYAGGDGTDENPWQIATCAQLNQMGDEGADGDNNDSYVLANNINCSGVSFESITFGESGDPFSGALDGAGYTISNVTINGTGTNRVGLFSALDGADIKNLTISNSTVSGNWQVGVLAGYAGFSTIDFVHVVGGSVTGTQTEDGSLGGLVGYSENSFYEGSSASATVSGHQTFNNGGLIGETAGGSLYQVRASGNVSGYQNVGGLIGRTDAYEGDVTSIQESFATGNVTAANQYGGGLIGYSNFASVYDSYARGNVSGGNYVGGLVGYNGFLFAKTYSTGQVTAADAEYIGGLVAMQGEAEMRHSFWDTQASLQASSNGGTGATTAQMKDAQLFTTDLGEDSWNFDYTWKINPDYNDGYPCLQWYSACSLGEESGNTGSELPNNGDGNNDGVVDVEQDNVVTIVSPVSEKYVTVAVDESCTLSNVSIASESNHTSQDKSYTYQSGFVNFTATGCEEGVANVELYYHGVSPDALIARKYNPITNTYFTIAGATISASSAPIPGTLVSYTIVDNGELDIDDTEGVIVDPVGLANRPSVPNTGIGGGKS